jgi:hypothetical protein
LSGDQKQRRLDVCSDIVSWPKETTFWIDLSRVMNYGAFSFETPKHAMENISVTKIKKCTHVTSPSEDNAHLFFYHRGIVHFEFLEQGRTVNQQCYL